MDISFKLLLIKSNPVVFLLIAKCQLVCTFKLRWRNTRQLLFIHHFLFSERAFMLKVYQMFYAIWYCLYNLKNVKSTYGGMPLLVNLQAYSWKYHIRRNYNSFYCNYILIVSRIIRSHQSRTLTFQKEYCYLLHSKLFKTDEKCVLFHLKNSFRSHDI